MKADLEYKHPVRTYWKDYAHRQLDRAGRFALDYVGILDPLAHCDLWVAVVVEEVPYLCQRTGNLLDVALGCELVAE